MVRLDGVQILVEQGLPLPTGYSLVTPMVGQTAGVSAGSGHFSWDNVQMKNHLNVDLLGNPGFESALLSTGTGTATGNFRPNVSGLSTAGRVTSPVQSGSWAGDTSAAAGGGVGYIFQDVAESFVDVDELTLTLNLDLYRHSGGYQDALIMFDWDRGIGHYIAATRLRIDPSVIQTEIFGVYGSLPLSVTSGVWHHLEISIYFNTYTAPTVGERWAPGFAFAH